MKFGEYLEQKQAITTEQLKEALAMQVDNPKLKLGEILVSKGQLSAQELLNWIERYIYDTGNIVAEMNRWLSQEEADMLIQKIRQEENL